MKTKQTPLLHPRQKFLEWYHVTTLGQILQTIEASYLQSALKLTYNQKTLQVGPLGSETLYIDREFLRDFALIDQDLSPPNPYPGLIVSNFDELPIASDSIDILILSHIIEFEAEPYPVLREAERILKPEGRLFLLGLNPWSLHGTLQYFPRGAAFQRANSVGSHRLLEWLAPLKLEAEIHAAFSVSSSQVLNRPSTLWDKTRAELAFAYAIRAIKRRYTLIPLEPRWVAAPSLAAGHMFGHHPSHHSTHE